MKKGKVDIKFLISLAREAGRIQMKYFHRSGSIRVRTKGPRDYVTVADYSSEKYIISRIKAKYPDHAILAEESGGASIKEHSGPFWVIDPLDGTTNYIHGVPIFSVSIAFFCDTRLQAGVVYDPTRKEMFWARSGKGAFLNGKRIRVSSAKRLGRALMATGFPFREKRMLEPYIQTFRTLSLRTRGIRRGGSAALDLVYTACGRFDGFWEFGLNIWDIAAGTLILQEAGARISDLDGSQNHLFTGNIVCGSPFIHRSMLRYIKQAKK